MPIVVKVIRGDAFLEFVRSHEEALLFAALALAEEYKAAFFRTRSLALSGVSGRIARLLLDLARTTSTGQTQSRFNMTLTHDDIAEVVCTSRETVTRTLGRFRKDRLIDVRGAALYILEAQKLEELAA